MLDGDEDLAGAPSSMRLFPAKEQDYIQLALFLSLSESGEAFYRLRPRLARLLHVGHACILPVGPQRLIRSKVTLAVLQKFLYFTTAIVCTIGFQLEAHPFEGS